MENYIPTLIKQMQARLKDDERMHAFSFESKNTFSFQKFYFFLIFQLFEKLGMLQYTHNIILYQMDVKFLLELSTK